MPSSEGTTPDELVLDSTEATRHSILIIAMRSMSDVFVLTNVDRPRIISTIAWMITQWFHAILCTGNNHVSFKGARRSCGSHSFESIFLSGNPILGFQLCCEFWVLKGINRVPIRDCVVFALCIRDLAIF
jgi:hypothetical protein